MATCSGLIDRDDKLPVQNENGFVWDDINLQSDELSSDEKLHRENVFEVNNAQFSFVYLSMILQSCISSKNMKPWTFCQSCCHACQSELEPVLFNLLLILIGIRSYHIRLTISDLVKPNQTSVDQTRPNK